MRPGPVAALLLAFSSPATAQNPDQSTFALEGEAAPGRADFAGRAPAGHRRSVRWTARQVPIARGRTLPDRFRSRRTGSRRGSRRGSRDGRQIRVALEVRRRAWRIRIAQYGPSGGRPDARICSGCAMASWFESAPRDRAGSVSSGWAQRLSGRRAGGSAASSDRSASIAACRPLIIAASMSRPGRGRWCRAGRRGGDARAAARVQPRGQSRHHRSRHGPDQRLPPPVARARSASDRPCGRGEPIGRVGATGRATGSAPPLEPGLERGPARSADRPRSRVGA